jgi:predicted acetyltransferase
MGFQYVASRTSFANMALRKLIINMLSILTGSDAFSKLAPFYSAFSTKYGYKDVARIENVAPHYVLISHLQKEWQLCAVMENMAI